MVNRHPETKYFLSTSRGQHIHLMIVADGEDIVLVSPKDDERLVNDLVTGHELVDWKRPDVQC